jgi:hypothetical protein
MYHKAYTVVKDHRSLHQRTAVERIFSQAKQLGMERPKLRNQQAITNLNTMIYLLINLRALQQVLARLAQSR